MTLALPTSFGGRGGGVKITIRGKRFLMDGCPRQNSSIAKRVIEKVGGLVFKIPPKSPDLNPIENFFHTICVPLNNDAIKNRIERETFVELS